MWKNYLLLLLFLFIKSNIGAQIFEKAKTDFSGVMQPVTSWIDFGDKKDLKAYLAGDYFKDDKHIVVSQVNTHFSKNKFKRVTTNLPALYRGDAAVSDYDNDGDEDIIVTGLTADNQMLMQLYQNNGENRFTPIREIFTPLIDGSVEWGDFDNDNDIDILITGKQANNNLSTNIYRNDKGYFTKLDVGIPGVYNGNATWSDYDNDNDLDILITGNVGGNPYTAIYKNTSNKYSMLSQRFIPLMNSAAAWGDFDNDGLVDFIISGADNDGYPLCLIYKNQSGSLFEEVYISCRPLMGCSIDLGDYDNDGDLDIIMTGESLERSYTIVYKNKLKFDFENIVAGLPGVADGNALWGDFDKDGDLDILMAGLTICYEFIGDIYINTSNPPKIVTSNNIFIDSPNPDTKIGPFYYYVFSSCFLRSRRR
ncbi:MAG TPA: VCBS repeat-containing protein [Bacteroidales bacterium]|jgi:hypothetical protein|nr:VCBS repeat-containing protein [Bacteroidales bacterium]|tara:strand:+ start:4067 stop:5335 length:1269 start_codon:yes stop_codon:yes gene_type:complete